MKWRWTRNKQHSDDEEKKTVDEKYRKLIARFDKFDEMQRSLTLVDALAATAAVTAAAASSIKTFREHSAAVMKMKFCRR